MHIIFYELPKYLDVAARLCSRFTDHVYYLQLPEYQQPGREKQARVADLKEVGVRPLPLEDLEYFEGIMVPGADPDSWGKHAVDRLIPNTLPDALSPLFPGVADAARKLRIAVHSSLFVTQTAKINIWARQHPGTRIWLVAPSTRGMRLSEREANVRSWVLPFDLISTGMNMVKGMAAAVWKKLAGRSKSSGDGEPEMNDSNEGSPARNSESRDEVAFVVHKGLMYGQLYEKTLFYSDNPESPRAPGSLLHLDYSGISAPREDIRWTSLSKMRGQGLSTATEYLTALWKGLRHVRTASHLYGLFMMVKIYVAYKSYRHKLASFPELHTALIDYEILCPKPLLLAFEAQGVATVAVQERFLSAFNKSMSTILDTYLCGSPAVADVIRQNPSFYIDELVPVGQYRSDSLVTFSEQSPPAILESPKQKGRKIITALGFHTQLDWQNSQTDPLLNWTAHEHFIKDMIRLSHELANIYIILRYKTLDWMELPEFGELLQKVKENKQLSISKDYSKPLISNELCAHSDLVIAKHTSLADECLSVGIPVLFHEYFHNTDTIISNIYDYGTARVTCYNFEQLRDRARMILEGGDDPLESDYADLRRQLYGNLGDGDVKDRIHEFLDRQIIRAKSRQC